MWTNEPGKSESHKIEILLIKFMFVVVVVVLSLLGGSTTSHERDAPKSRFLDQPGLASSSHHHLGGAGPSGANMGAAGGNGGGGMGGGHLNGNGYLNDSNLLNDSSLLNGAGGNQLNGMNGVGGGGNGAGGAANSAANMQSNHMFEKILSEVIHVSAYDQRTSINSGYSNDLMGGSNMANPALQDMPFKLKGKIKKN